MNTKKKDVRDRDLSISYSQELRKDANCIARLEQPRATGEHSLRCILSLHPGTLSLMQQYDWSSVDQTLHFSELGRSYAYFILASDSALRYRTVHDHSWVKVA